VSETWRLWVSVVLPPYQPEIPPARLPLLPVNPAAVQINPKKHQKSL